MRLQDLSKRFYILILAVFAVFCISAAPLRMGCISLWELEDDMLDDKIKTDLNSISIYRDGLCSVLEFLIPSLETLRPDSSHEASVPPREAKENVWNVWKGLLDYYLALESIRSYYRDFYRLKDKKRRADAFLVSYASFLVQYRFALEFLEKSDDYPELDIILNEPVPELGLPGRTYAGFKFRFLNVARAVEFAALQVQDKAFGSKGFPTTRANIKKDSSLIFRMGQGTGEMLTLKNAVKVIKDAGFQVWLPVQTGISQWMADIKVRRIGKCLISQEQIRNLISQLLPGDILLQRREWYMTNVGLPGFWTHAALYIGNPEERRKFFKSEKVCAWVRQKEEGEGDFEALLRKCYPEAYELCTKVQKDGHIPRVLEAVGEGVIFTTIEHSAAADSIVVFRPKLPVVEKAEALLRAFHYSGRPYDFNFDFMTDSCLVCSELIFKAYEPAQEFQGLHLPLLNVLGRKVLPPNEIARLFDKEFGIPEQQMDFVLFLDGYEGKEMALESSLEKFRETWKRPKWHILIQGEPEEI